MWTRRSVSDAERCGKVKKTGYCCFVAVVFASAFHGTWVVGAKATT